jgi:hypothetical protein
VPHMDNLSFSEVLVSAPQDQLLNGGERIGSLKFRVAQWAAARIARLVETGKVKDNRTDSGKAAATVMLNLGKDTTDEPSGSEPDEPAGRAPR